MKHLDKMIVIAVVLVIIYLLCMFCMFLGYWIADVFFWFATL